MDDSEVAALPQLPDKSSKPRFWKRQFAQQATQQQRIFDVVFGMIAPILALIFDPVLFKDTICLGTSTNGGASLFTYLAVALGIITLAIWLRFGDSLQRTAPLISGTLLFGAVLAGLLGILLLPYSLFGLLLFCIGALGFLPFVTAFVYLRNGARAWRGGHQATQSVIQFVALVPIGAALVIGPPLIAQRYATQVATSAVDQLTSNSATVQSEGAQRIRNLSSLCLGLCAGTIETAFSAKLPSDYTERMAWKATYRDVTGSTMIDCSPTSAQ